MPSRPDAVALLRDLAATPRPTGSDAIAAARERVERDLSALGFARRDLPFAFSAFPGRFATPLFGGAALFIVGAAGHLGFRGAQVAPLAITALGATVLLVAGFWLSRRGVLDAPVLRSRGVNMEFTRGESRPAVWLCAHLDTKSQPVPTLLRATGIVLASLGYAATLALSVAAAAGAEAHEFWWAAAALVTLVGAIPVVSSMVGTRSPGALDNASGVAAVVEAARLLAGRDVGVLVTDAEELGLAGARAWSRERVQIRVARDDRVVVLNCDGVDDEGRIVAMYSGRPPGSVLDAIARASRGSGIAARPRRMVPGLLTDSVAFAEAGMASVTFSRGTAASLARVHSTRDDLSRLHGTGIAEAGALIAATAAELGSRRSS